MTETEVPGLPNFEQVLPKNQRKEKQNMQGKIKCRHQEGDAVKRESMTPSTASPAVIAISWTCHGCHRPGKERANFTLGKFSQRGNGTKLISSSARYQWHVICFKCSGYDEPLRSGNALFLSHSNLLICHHPGAFVASDDRSAPFDEPCRYRSHHEGRYYGAPNLPRHKWPRL